MDSKEIKPVILKEINPEYSLEGLMLKLRLHNFGLLMQKADSLKKTLIPGKSEGKRTGQQRMRQLDSITDSMEMNLSKLQEIVQNRGICMLQFMGSWRVRHEIATNNNKMAERSGSVNSVEPFEWLPVSRLKGRKSPTRACCLSAMWAGWMVGGAPSASNGSKHHG